MIWTLRLAGGREYYLVDPHDFIVVDYEGEPRDSHVDDTGTPFKFATFGPPAARINIPAAMAHALLMLARATWVRQTGVSVSGGSLTQRWTERVDRMRERYGV